MWVDYYRLLGVAPGASPQAIRREYRRLAARFHPDLCAGDPAARDAAEQRMKAINAAYHTLKDVSRRAAYDREHARPLGARAAAPRAQPRPLYPTYARPTDRLAGMLAGLALAWLIWSWPHPGAALATTARCVVEGRTALHLSLPGRGRGEGAQRRVLPCHSERSEESRIRHAPRPAGHTSATPTTSGPANGTAPPPPRAGARSLRRPPGPRWCAPPW